MQFTETEKQVFKKMGAVGGKTAAERMTKRQLRERGLKASHSPAAKAWRQKLRAFARQEATK